MASKLQQYSNKAEYLLIYACVKGHYLNTRGGSCNMLLASDGAEYVTG